MEDHRRIAILGGTGDQGFGLALRLAKAGEHVIIGSRQLDRALEAAKKATSLLGSRSSVDGKENRSAAAEANLIFICVPFEALVKTLTDIKESLKEGDIVVDVTNPLASAIGGTPTKTLRLWEGSAAELTAKILRGKVKVVSAFKNVVAAALQDLPNDLDCDVIVCGDDRPSKKEVMELVERIPGARSVDGGPLENSRIIEELTALLIDINIRYKVARAGIRLTGIGKL